jgi:hypothetical protein
MASSSTSTGTTSATITSVEAASKLKRTYRQVLRSYFYWTYPRGAFHYDIMVTLILLFIFATPHLWDYGAKPSVMAVSGHALQVFPNGRDVIITVQASDVSIPAGASYREGRKALRKAVEPVTGDDVIVEHWETATDSQENLVWKVWAHR